MIVNLLFTDFVLKKKIYAYYFPISGDKTVLDLYKFSYISYLLYFPPTTVHLPPPPLLKLYSYYNFFSYIYIFQNICLSVINFWSISRNWNFRECIEFGLNCKTSSIRYDFLNFLVAIWMDGGLCARLGTMMTDDFNYDVECSIAFYIQLLFVKITKNTKLLGDYAILRKLSTEKTVSFNFFFIRLIDFT